MQRVTDGHMAVVGHGGQQEAADAGEPREAERLGQAASIRNPFVS